MRRLGPEMETRIRDRIAKGAQALGVRIDEVGLSLTEHRQLLQVAVVWHCPCRIDGARDALRMRVPIEDAEHAGVYLNRVLANHLRSDFAHGLLSELPAVLR